MRISSLKFILLFTFYLSAVNFIFFYKIFTIFQNNEKFYIVPLILMCFFFIAIVISLLFVKFLSKIIAVSVTAICGICGYFMYNYGSIIDSEMIKNIIQTDATEVKNLLSAKFFIWMFVLVIVPIFFILKSKISYFSFTKELKIRAVLIIISLLIIGVNYAIFGKTFIPFFRENKTLRFYTLPFYQIYSAVKFTKKSFTTPRQFIDFGKDSLKDNNQNSLLVFVVGETQRSANYSLNGYTVNDTNFYTKNNKDLVSFNNFYSCGTNTATSLPCMFSDLTRENFSSEEAKYRENLVQILLEAGVEIYWLDNNSGGCKGICDDLDENHTVNFKARKMDRAIFQYAKQIKIKDAPTAIFLHIQGSHGPTYFKDYENAKFKPTCDTAELNDCTSEQIVNAYDNSILYEDELQNDMIEYLKTFNKNKKIFFLFVSDHGESLGENGLYLHSMPYLIAPDFQKKVPALFWFNDTNTSKKFAAFKNEKFSHDNLFHTILGFFDVKSPAYNKNLDMFSQE